LSGATFEPSAAGSELFQAINLNRNPLQINIDHDNREPCKKFNGSN